MSLKATVQIGKPYLLKCFVSSLYSYLDFQGSELMFMLHVLIMPVFNGVRESFMSELIKCQSDFYSCQWSHA